MINQKLLGSCDPIQSTLLCLCKCFHIVHCQLPYFVCGKFLSLLFIVRCSCLGSKIRYMVSFPHLNWAVPINLWFHLSLVYPLQAGSVEGISSQWWPSYAFEYQANKNITKKHSKLKNRSYSGMFENCDVPGMAPIF